jgi:hypothetical protein
MIGLGDKVFLKACRVGIPGVVIRSGRKLTVYWNDLDHWSKHHPDSLMLAEVAGDSSGGIVLNPPKELPATLAALLEQADEGGL